jgi:sulfonate transport system permease protein
MAVDERTLTAGLDALEVPVAPRVSRALRVWRTAWPKLLAVAIAWALWQLLYWIEWKPHYALPSPEQAVQSIFDNWDVISTAIRNTLSRAVYGYALALVIGTTIGALVARNKVLRAGIGSMITGLQTMPSVAWFPAAVLLFGLNDSAIIFVVVMGAAPSIANGLIGGVDHVPPILIRAGNVLGARGFTLLRSVILPAALPGYIGGLKQGWAFAWRSLMAGELLVIIGSKPSLGVRLDFARQLSDTPLLIAYMIVILIIGIIVDAIFGIADRRLRARRGLLIGN